jgi:hypothetical protein
MSGDTDVELVALRLIGVGLVLGVILGLVLRWMT